MTTSDYNVGLIIFYDRHPMQVLLAQPRGFCAGVTRAITIVKRALEVYGAPIYVRHEIVHNRTVVSRLKERGAIFIDDLKDVPEGATLIYSAHGVPKSVEREARARGLRIFDATCPLVTKVHREVSRMHANGKTIVMIGHAGHPEVEGTMGQVDSGIELVESVEDVAKLEGKTGAELSYVSQTTLSIDDASEIIDALKTRFPDIGEPKKSDVCYATQNRQDAVKTLAQNSQLVLVIGSTTSSNSNRLREVAQRYGAATHLVDSAEHLDPAWFDGVDHVGITAGASAPEDLVQGVVQYLRTHFDVSSVQTLPGAEENIAFPMPKGLWQSDLDHADCSQQQG